MKKPPGIKKANEMRERYMVMRMFVRIHDQANKAYLANRTTDFCSLCTLIGRLEYLHYEGGCMPSEESK